ncbi:HlyD family secretion protein [Massilia norwichensis]|uniref:Biotin/lipoyl-binding protein n=1 Tax=Massilia norwichensis TaxID=1442366 RepID=A0ABT2A1J0_9BURK|nr:efflux RND transporter periplasmic adaptor subunit [Massilia norwichensis]MCS0587952.1 biotin/lipoyl-binding protein [Massilia norwichensis]
MANPNRKRALAGVAGILVLGLLGWGLYRSLQPVPDALQGQVEAQEINVSSKVPGRVGQVHVQLGQAVSRGQLLFELDSPEVRAKVAQAQAAREAAGAVVQKAQAGARPEEIAAARANWERAEAGARLAEVTYQRVGSMVAEGVLARQKGDEAQAQARSARELASAAKAQYDLARQGARKEDKEAAQAQARQVDGVVAEADAALAETRILAPAAGEVSKLAIQAGELAPQGFPVVTLVDLNDVWAVLAVREDMFKAFAMDTVHEAGIPALKTHARFKVTAVSALPAFATWRAASPGGTDLRTFEVRLRPTAAVPGLRPGMTVVFEH